jgi:hypothetical protein
MLPDGASRPHIKVKERMSHRVVVACFCGAECVIKYRDAMAAMLAKQLSDPPSRRIDILTSEL